MKYNNRDNKGRFVRRNPYKSQYFLAPKIAFTLLLLYILLGVRL